MTAKKVADTVVSATRCASYLRSHALPARRASHILMFCCWGMVRGRRFGEGVIAEEARKRGLYVHK